jgi:heat shock protein HslJ
MKKILSAVLFGLIFLGCSANSPQVQNTASTQTLKNSVWVLEEINGEKMRYAIMESEALGESAIVFGDDIMSGNTGVNQFKAQYSAQNGYLTTSAIAATQMATFHKNLADNEQNIFAVLNGERKTYKLENDALIISSDDKTLLYKRFDPLAYSSWSLVKLNDKYLSGEGLGRAPFLEFSKDKVSGYLGRDLFNADFGISQNIVKIANIQKGDQPETDTKESQELQKEFVQIITSSPSLELPVPTMLTLNSRDGNLTFSRANFLKFLDNSKWQLEDISGEKIEGRKPIVEFRDGSVFGNGGINMYNGKFALKDRQIYIDSLISTKMAGLPNAMELESRYLKALENAKYIEIRGYGILQIFSGNDVLTFSRQ